MKLMLAVVVALIVTTTPGFAATDEASQAGRETGALIGRIVGLGAGFVASAIYSHTTHQCDNDVYQHTFPRCGLPIAGMMIGGAFAGHFIGRLADKPPNEEPLRKASGQGSKPLTVPAPAVKLGQPTPFSCAQISLLGMTEREGAACTRVSSVG